MSRRGAIGALATAAVLLSGCGGDGNGDTNGNRNGDLGREVFTSIADPACGSCHVLEDAGTSGTVGPNLDQLQPSPSQVEQAVRSGVGAMPSFEDQLTDEQIDAVATYVSDAARG